MSQFKENTNSTSRQSIFSTIKFSIIIEGHKSVGMNLQEDDHTKTMLGQKLMRFTKAVSSKSCNMHVTLLNFQI